MKKRKSVAPDLKEEKQNEKGTERKLLEKNIEPGEMERPAS